MVEAAVVVLTLCFGFYVVTSRRNDARIKECEALLDRSRVLAAEWKQNYEEALALLERMERLKW